MSVPVAAIDKSADHHQHRQQLKPRPRLLLFRKLFVIDLYFLDIPRVNLSKANSGGNLTVGLEAPRMTKSVKNHDHRQFNNSRDSIRSFR